KGGIAGNDEEPADAGESGDDFLDHSVCEIFLLGVAAHVLKRHHRYRRLIGKRKRRTYNRGSGRRGLASDPVCLDRLSDIFHLLLAEIGEPDREFCPYLIPHRTGNANPARLRKSLQSGRDINSVAKEVVALDDDVADVDAD